MLKKLNMVLFSFLIAFVANTNAYAKDAFIEDEYIEEFEDEPQMSREEDFAEEISVNALNEYQVEGSLFERITNLEQEKVVMQLEKERAQLDLELDRLNAERIKLQMELDTLSGRAEQQQQELEMAKAELEAQSEKLKRQREAMEQEEYREQEVQPQPKKQDTNITKKYKLINVVGVDNQLQATIEDVVSGQNRRIAVGKELDGYIVKSISLNEGIVFEKDGIEESLNIGK